MTKKDFELIAAALRASRPDPMRIAASEEYIEGCENQFRLSCETITKAVQTTNPRFDRARFLAACGVQS